MYIVTTAKSFKFVDTKFRGLTIIDMFEDSWLCGFLNIYKTTKLNKYFIGILNLCIVLPTQNTKLNVQQIKIILQYTAYHLAQTFLPVSL